MISESDHSDGIRENDESEIPTEISPSGTPMSGTQPSGTPPSGEAPKAKPAAPIPERPLDTSRRSRRIRVASLSITVVLSFSIATYFKNLHVFFAISIIVFSPLALFAANVEKEMIFPVITGWAYILGPFAAAAIIYGVFRIVKKKPVSLGKCLVVLFKKFIPLLIVIICIVVMIFVLTFVILIPFRIIFGADFSEKPLLSLIVFIPILFVITITWLASPAVVVENLGPFRAIRRSMALTRGNRWKIFFIIMFLGVILILTSIAVTLIIGFLGMASGLVFNILTFVMTIVFNGIAAIAVAKTFFMIKTREEGADEDELAAIFD